MPTIMENRAKLVAALRSVDPEDWDFESHEKCAMGIAQRLWIIEDTYNYNQLVNLIGLENAEVLWSPNFYGIPYDDEYRYQKVTANMVADAIEASSPA